MAPACNDLRINLSSRSSLTADFSPFVELQHVGTVLLSLFLIHVVFYYIFTIPISDVAVAQMQQERTQGFGGGGLSESFQYCDIRATAAH